jgi:hypothetical protein
LVSFGRCLYLPRVGWPRKHQKSITQQHDLFGWQTILCFRYRINLHLASKLFPVLQFKLLYLIAWPTRLAE